VQYHKVVIFLGEGVFWLFMLLCQPIITQPIPVQTMPAVKSPKQSYPFQIKLRHYCGQLSNAEKKIIPRSTLSYWAKSKITSDFKANTLWEKLDDIEPAHLIFENKKLAEQNSLLAHAAAGLSALVKNPHLSNIDKIKEFTSLQKACSYFSITCQQYYAFKNNTGCYQGLVKLCRKKYPNQLTDAEINCIKKYMTDERYLQWSRATVYWQMCRTEGNRFAKSTFYKYCNLLGFGRRRGPFKCKNNTGGIVAVKVGEIIHVDITEIYAHNSQKIYLLFIQDNFSRNIIAYHAALCNNAALQAATIKNAQQSLKVGLNTVSIITDGGSENKGAVDTMLAQYFPLAKKIVAKVDIAFANNMVEALHYKMKYQVLPKAGFKNYEEVVTKLPLYVAAYNQMPHDRLNGGTPHEIYNGIMPNIQNRAVEIKTAAFKRLEQNKLFNCCLLLE
jgi:putative transposase